MAKLSLRGVASSAENNDVITSAIKYGHIGDFVIYDMHGKD